MTKEQQIKHTVLVSLSAYATHKEYTIDEWFKANKANVKMMRSKRLITM